MTQNNRMELFPSTLIISSSLDLINQKVDQICQQLNHLFNPNNPDIFVINQETGWGIDEVRKIKFFLAQKPFNHSQKIVFIFEAHQLNSQAQNALLKTLEEPGENNYIVLTTNKASSLLPTIISRCNNIKISSAPKKITTKLLNINGNINKDLLTSENLAKNKEDVLPLLEEQLKLYQQELIKNPSKENSKIIEKIIKSIQMINSNVDPKSALDYFFLA